MHFNAGKKKKKGKIINMALKPNKAKKEWKSSFCLDRRAP